MAFLALTHRVDPLASLALHVLFDDHSPLRREPDLERRRKFDPRLIHEDEEPCREGLAVHALKRPVPLHVLECLKFPCPGLPIINRVGFYDPSLLSAEYKH